MLRILLCLLLVLGLTSASYSQKGKTSPTNAPKLDQKKLAKANTMIAQAMKEKDKGKQGELINNALELYRDMKMFKEGNIAVGDAFYNKDDIKTADRFYAKGGKENKTEMKDKIGKAYLEDAFKESDPKLQKKAFENAFKALSKAYTPAEANRMIGNEFFDMGMDYYPQALGYFEKAGYNEGIYLIGDLYAAKPENIEQGVATYIMLKEREGYKKAGDLYYNSVGTVLKYYTGSAWVSITSGGITDLVQDTTPQLGGALDVNTFSITSTSNGNITLQPNGTGDVVLSADTVKFHPADIAGVFDVDMTNTDFIVERQSNWDSVSRDYIFIMPLKMEDSGNRVVTTAFTETRYVKDGTSESINFYERLYINEQDKIMRVVQYSRPPND